MNNNTPTSLPLRRLLYAFLFTILFLGISPLLHGQFTGGVAVTDQSLLNKSWHISNKTDNKLLVPDNGQLRDNSNAQNETSTWIIEDIPDDGKWWTADKKWFAIRNAATGLYVTIQNTITSGKGRDVGFEELGPTNNPGLRTRQQFELVPIAGDYYKIRSRVEGSTSFGKLILKCDDDGVTYAVENNLLGDRVSFAFNLALPSINAAVYSLSGVNISDFVSDRGKSSENSQLVHFEDHDQSALWNFIQSGDGNYYYIRNALTGNYISNNGNNGDNAPLVMKTSPGESTKWEVIRAGVNVRIRSKGGGTTIPQFIGVNGYTASGQQLYGAKSNVIGIEWVLLRITESDPEPKAGNYDHIPVTPNLCPVLFGPVFKKAVAERAGLPADEAYFPIVEEALKQYYNGDATLAYNALINFDMDNTGHRVELVFAVKDYLLGDVAMRNLSTWTPIENQAIQYFNQKVQAIRINYGERLQQTWNEFIEGQYEELTNSGFNGLLNAAIDTDLEWPSDYDMSGKQFDDIANFASATKTFNLNNNKLNFAYGAGASVVAAPGVAILVNKLVMKGLSGAVHQLIKLATDDAIQVALNLALRKTPALVATGISGSTTSTIGTTVGAAIGSAGTVISVVTMAAQVLAAQIQQALEFQKLENKVNQKIFLSQQIISIAEIMQGDDELAKLKLVSDMEFLLAAPVANVFVNNYNDNITFEPFSNVTCNNVTVSLDANCTAQVLPTAISGGFILANCGGPVTLSLDKSSFTANDLVSPQTVTLTASNSLKTSTCTATVTVQDITPPTVTCKPFTVDLFDILGITSIASIVPANVLQSSSDNCGTPELVSVTPNFFYCSNVGDNEVTLKVKDAGGNEATCQAIVTVRDINPPVAKCKNRTVQLDASGNGSLTATQVDDGSSDMCGIYDLSLNTTSFTCANVGNNNTVVLTVEDVNNNTSSCTATVTVVDNVPPIALCQSVTVYLNANGQGSLTAEQMDNGSSDACGILSRTLSKTTFDCSNVGPNSVTLTVTDNNNKSSQCSANVQVVDNVPPVALCQTVVVQLDANGEGSLTAEQMDAGSNDACGIQSRTLNRYTFDCTDLGTVPMTLTVKDQNNNESTCNASVIVQDNIFPEITCPNNIVVTNDPGDCSAVVNFTVNASDNCTFSVAKLAGYNTGQPFPVGVTTNQFQVTDAADNQASCSFTVTVNKFGDPDLLYAYTVIGLNGVDLKQNTLAAGGIGVVNANKKVKLESGTVINAANTFVKAPTLDLNSGSSAQAYHQAQVPTGLLPVFVPNDNPLNTNLDIADNSAPVVLSLGNYGKITIGKNVTATISGNATVMIKELKLKEGAKLFFSQNTSVHIDKKMDLDKNATLDKGSHTVWMFVEDDVKIEEGGTVFANIYSQKTIKVEKAIAVNTTKMTGLFIAETVDAKEYVSWNWDVAQCPFVPTNNIVSNGTLDLFAIQSKETAKLTCFSNLGASTRRLYIERSADGFNYEPLFEAADYDFTKKSDLESFLDESPHPGMNFYRAAAELSDGTTVYSPVRRLEYNLTDPFNLFPNPANSRLFVYCEKLVGKTGTISIYNSQGVQVMQHSYDAVPDGILTFDVSEFRDGLYLVSVKGEGRREITKRLVISK